MLHALFHFYDPGGATILVIIGLVAYVMLRLATTKRQQPQQEGE